MAGFRDRRVMLLVLVVLISGIFIAGPGPHWGVDITGGSRIMLRLEAREATVKFSPTPDNFSKAIGSVKETLESNLHTNVIILSADDETYQLNLVIGKAVEESVVNELLKEEGAEITDFKDADFDREPMGTIREELIDHLELRVDPYGTLGAQFKPLGSEYVLFEVPLELERAKELLGHEGRLEIFIEDQLVLRGDHIKNVESVRKSYTGSGYEIPFELTDEGAQRFASASEGKGGYPGVIYLDRPGDVVLIFVEAPFPNLEYDGDNHMFRYTRVTYPFHLQVPAVKIKRDSIPEEAQEFLKDQRGLKTGAILVGNPEDFSENVIRGENLIVDNEPLYPITSVSARQHTIMEQVCGARSWPIIAEDLAGNIQAAKTGLRITTGSDLNEAKNLQVILSQRLPVEVSHESEAELDPRLGRGFLWEALQAGGAAFIAVGALVYIRYRRLKIAIPLMLTMLCEVVITLGFSSALPDTVMSIGLPEIGGLIAVVGTGVDHQIIITDEIIRGKSPRAGRIPIERRTGRAFSIIFAAAATTIAAMVALVGLGFGAMRGFAIIAIIGVLISVLITRPAYARIVGTLLVGEQ